MKGYRLNKDINFVYKIMEGIEKKGGHCPCRIVIDDTTLCPCNEFIEKGICRCKLFLPIKEEK